MDRLHFVAALVLALTLAVPGALAAPVEGDLVTSSLQAVGLNSLDGQVVAFVRVRETPLGQELLNQTESEELPPAAFTLQASRLRVEVDTADPVVHSPETWVLLPETYSTARS